MPYCAPGGANPNLRSILSGLFSICPNPRPPTFLQRAVRNLTISMNNMVHNPDTCLTVTKTQRCTTSKSSYTKIWNALSAQAWITSTETAQPQVTILMLSCQITINMLLTWVSPALSKIGVGIFWSFDNNKLQINTLNIQVYGFKSR